MAFRIGDRVKLTRKGAEVYTVFREGETGTIVGDLGPRERRVFYDFAPDEPVAATNDKPGDSWPVASDEIEPIFENIGDTRTNADGSVSTLVDNGDGSIGTLTTGCPDPGPLVHDPVTGVISKARRE